MSWGECLGRAFGQMPEIHERPGIYQFTKYGLYLYSNNNNIRT